MPRPRPISRRLLSASLLSLVAWLPAAPGCTRRDVPRSQTGSAALVRADSGVSSPQPAPPPRAAPSGPSGAPAAVSGSAAPLQGQAPLPARELTWAYEQTAVGPMVVVVSIPHRASDGEKFPVLITMHGRGEAFKGPARGARGWIDDYWMPRAIDRLEHPPLVPQDLLFLSPPERLERINQSLAHRPYRGLIVVCPYTPDILAGDRPLVAARPLGEFLVDVLLPRVYRETPALGTSTTTGIEGVSLGGRASLLVGLARASAFGVVAGLQPAFDSADAPELGKQAELARKTNPKLVLRLLTSEGDFFLNPTRAIAREWRQRGIEHELVVIPGPHNYEFNRGPGVFEMLLFHDRALRGEPSL